MFVIFDNLHYIIKAYILRKGKQTVRYRTTKWKLIKLFRNDTSILLS